MIEEKPITAGTKKNKGNWKLNNNVQLIPSHEYYILNINKREIELRNPHGNDTFIGGNVFKIMISDFNAYFDMVSLNF